MLAARVVAVLVAVGGDRAVLDGRDEVEDRVGREHVACEQAAARTRRWQPPPRRSTAARRCPSAVTSAPVRSASQRLARRRRRPRCGRRPGRRARRGSPAGRPCPATTTTETTGWRSRNPRVATLERSCGRAGARVGVVLAVAAGARGARAACRAVRAPRSRPTARSAAPGGAGGARRTARVRAERSVTTRHQPLGRREGVLRTDAQGRRRGRRRGTRRSAARRGSPRSRSTSSQLGSDDAPPVAARTATTEDRSDDETRLRGASGGGGAHGPDSPRCQRRFARPASGTDARGPRGVRRARRRDPPPDGYPSFLGDGGLAAFMTPTTRSVPGSRTRRGGPRWQWSCSARARHRRPSTLAARALGLDARPPRLRGEAHGRAGARRRGRRPCRSSTSRSARHAGATASRCSTSSRATRPRSRSTTRSGWRSTRRATVTLRDGRDSTSSSSQSPEAGPHRAGSSAAAAQRPGAGMSSSAFVVYWRTPAGIDGST